MVKKSLFALITYCLIAGTFTSCEDKPLTIDHKTKVALIFCDVTNSLIRSESQEVANLAARIIDSFPTGTKYTVYPINVETQRLSAIVEGQIIAESNEQAEIAVRNVRRKAITENIEKLYDVTNGVKDNFGKADNRTCILNTLVFSENYFRQFNDYSRYEQELIFISDMIEECNRTPLGKRVELAHRNISKEITLIKNSPLNINLSYARITIIIPTTQDTYKYPPGRRPSVEDVKEFWKNTFMKCGFNDESLKDEKQFYFAPGLPERFKAVIR